MAETFTGDSAALLAEIERIRADLKRCLAFIRTIPDNEPGPTHNGWVKELRAIKREVKA